MYPLPDHPLPESPDHLMPPVISVRFRPSSRTSCGKVFWEGYAPVTNIQNQILEVLPSIWMFKVMPGFVILAISVVEIHIIDIGASLGNDNQLQVAITI